MVHSTPVGVSDFVPADAILIQKQSTVLNNLFMDAGYAPIKTPTIEYSESIEHALGPHLAQQCIEFFGPDGKRYMLRPDYTTPIARTVATRMKEDPLPLKLCYVDTVFRKSNAEKKSDMEIFQAGCEVIGDNSSAGVSDLIDLCLQALESLGYASLGIDLGHMDYIKKLSEAQREALLRRDYKAFGSIP